MATARDTLARRLSAALCAALLGAFGWGLARYTGGFELWTFEARRQALLQQGALRAAPVALRDQQGEASTPWHDGGDAAPAVYLVDFIYTRCPGVCRVLGSEFQRMQQELAAQPTRAAGTVRLLSLSFDVEHDDPTQLRRYAASLHADPAYWSFAAPATDRDARVLLRSLGVVVVPDGDGGFVHNGDIHLLDARGRLRGLYEADQWPQALADARRLAGAKGESR
ncbi:MAG TPA: SCO family protein [Albitalea sp.]|nr:SCO family protein [Albitalea sp.]